METTTRKINLPSKSTLWKLLRDGLVTLIALAANYAGKETGTVDIPADYSFILPVIGLFVTRYLRDDVAFNIMTILTRALSRSPEAK